MFFPSFLIVKVLSYGLSIIIERDIVEYDNKQQLDPKIDEKDIVASTPQFSNNYE